MERRVSVDSLSSYTDWKMRNKNLKGINDTELSSNIFESGAFFSSL